MIGWIIFGIWVLSFAGITFFGVIAFSEKEGWAFLGFIISLIIFVLIPLSLLLAILQIGIEWFQSGLQNILG